MMSFSDEITDFLQCMPCLFIQVLLYDIQIFEPFNVGKT